jgi:crossover junction endodeoxyribonuclease RusA
MSTESRDLFEPPQTVVKAGETLTLKFPWPPSVNGYWGNRVAQKRVVGKYLTDDAREFRDAVIAIVLQHFGKYPEPIRGDVILDIVLHPPDKRRRDGDNYNKGLWDAMRHARLFADDDQVHSYRVTKAPPVKGGLVIVKLWERNPC